MFFTCSRASLEPRALSAVVCGADDSDDSSDSDSSDSSEDEAYKKVVQLQVRTPAPSPIVIS